MDILPSSLTEDYVIGILSEMNNYRLEKNLILPVLKELREKVSAKTENEIYLKYLKLIYSRVEHNLIDKEGAGIERDEDAVFFTIIPSGKKYSELTNWLFKKYEKVVSKDDCNVFETDSLLNIKKYGKYDEEEPGVWSVKITNNLLAYPELLNEILGQANVTMRRFKYAMLVLDYLDEKYKSIQPISKMIKIPNFKR